jgi:hypothetical protein
MIKETEMLGWVGKVFTLPKYFEAMIDQGNEDVAVGRQRIYATKKLRTND